MNNEFKGTSFPWTISANTMSGNKVLINNGIIEIWRRWQATEEEHNANVAVVLKAPELLEKLLAAKYTLASLRRSITAHPDCEEGSEFDDMSSTAQRLENEIENLINEATSTT